MAVCSHIQVSNNYPVIRMATVISDNTLKWEAKTMNGAYKNYVEAEIPPMDSARRDVESIKTYPEKNGGTVVRMGSHRSSGGASRLSSGDLGKHLVQL